MAKSAKLLHMKRLFTSLCLILLCVGCARQELSPEQLSQERASGVVLVLNHYYYKITLPDSKVVYCTGYDEAQEELTHLTTNLADIADKRNLITGTGFFVSEKGEILTNRHIASPTFGKAIVHKLITQKISEMYDYWFKMISQYAGEEEADGEEKTRSTLNRWGDLKTVAPLTNKQRLDQEKRQRERRRLTAFTNQLNSLALNQVRVEIVSELSIAYNNTFLTSVKETKPCSVVRLSDKEAIDLALLQLNDKETPRSAYVFDLRKKRDDTGFFATLASAFRKDAYNADVPCINEIVTMIGYHAGSRLAAAAQGIKAQTASGTISQEPDADRLLYSIPALPGSSGSPVMNCYGEVVAVNFADMQQTQGFNYGIRVKRVRQFLYK